MHVRNFIGVGENIHCTRIYKVGGKFCRESGGGFVIGYVRDGVKKELPVPAAITESPEWAGGRVKHCAVAIWQANYADGALREAGADYLKALALEQEASGAHYLDINLDEFSTDVEERVRLMKWTVELVQGTVRIPVSVDSSNTEILRAGLEATDAARGRPMVNSVSLERMDAVAAARECNAVVIASAAGEKGLPSTVEERMQNLERLVARLRESGFRDSDLHIDPLVFPISVDGRNGPDFLNTCRAVRDTYGENVHVVAGLSNVSFGMPNRKLINQVFAWLAVEAGADGGIVDPGQINADILSSLDPEAEDFKLAQALLLGEDEFGMNYISTMRDKG